MGQTDRMDWKYQKGKGWDRDNYISGRRIGSAVIDYWGVEGGRKRRLKSLPLALQGVWSICAIEENNNNTLYTNPNYNI